MELNTHPSNRPAVPAGTVTVDAMEIASGPTVDTYPVQGTVRTASQRPQRRADEEEWQLPVPPPRPDPLTTTPFKDMLVIPCDTEKLKVKGCWSPQRT